MSAPAADALTGLLAAYADPDPEQAMRLLDVPTDLRERCLGYLLPDLAHARLNLIQPAAAWPATGDLPSALEAAVAEAWWSWTALAPTRAGAGTDLLTGTLPAGAAVVGLWWD